MTTTAPRPTVSASDAARSWIEAYGIRTEPYTRSGGDHPMMATLPAAFEAFAAQVRQAEQDAAEARASKLAEANEELQREAQFLVNRLNDLDDDAFTDEGMREFHGHVFPSLSRLRALLTTDATTTKTGGGDE